MVLARPRKKEYEKEVEAFLDYHIARAKPWTEDTYSNNSLHITAIVYFEYRHGEISTLKKNEGKGKATRFASTTLRSKFVILKQFFKHTGRGALEYDCSIIESNLSKWDKNQVKQAKDFSLEELGKFNTNFYSFFSAFIYSII